MKSLEVSLNSAVNIITKPEHSKIQLNQMILKSFDTLTASKIMDNCKFIPIDPSKLGVQVNSTELSNQEKNLLRICIKSAYGDDINIISLPPLKEVKTESEAIKPVTINTSSIWFKIRNDLFKCFPSKLSEHAIKAWFDNLSL